MARGHLQACGPGRVIELTVDRWAEDDELGAEEALIALSCKVVIALGDVYPVASMRADRWPPGCARFGRIPPR
jgi:hypothetical protein